MRNSTIIYYFALCSFIISFFFYELNYGDLYLTIRLGDILLGASLGFVISNLLINFRKENLK